MKPARLVALLTSALTVTAIAPGTSSAATGLFGGPRSSVVGHVYVNDNTAGENTVAAFDRHADGSLTPIPGSPFPAGGAGTGAGIGSQGALQESTDGRYVLAVDAGSGQISVLRITPDGGLRPVSGGPVSSGGAEPVSVAINGGLVYVANGGSGANNYTGFTLNRGGQLRPLGGSTIALPEGSEPGDVLFNPSGTNLVGVRVKTSLIDSFAVGADGRLTAAPESPIAAQGPGPFGSEFRPTDPDQLFVSNAHGGAGAGTVSAFDVAGDGALSSIGESPFADHETAPCWVEISRNGRFLFTVNTASNSISRYEIAPSGSLELLGSTQLNEAGAGAEDARLDPEGDVLFIVETAGRAVAGFSVDGGALTALPSSPTSLPSNSAPFGIVVD
jgi:6-phosphogluconolactonase (cycloisomerase 2 family)